MPRKTTQHHNKTHTDEIPKIVAAKKEWESTVDALPQLICLIDQNGYLIRANRTVEHWDLGSIQDVAGKSLHNLLHPNCTQSNCWGVQLWENIFQSLNQGDYYSQEVDDPVRNATYEIHAQPVQPGNQTGNHRSFASVVISDTTERKQMENEIARYMQQSTLLHTIEGELTTTLDVQHVMEIGTKALRVVTGTDKPVLILLDPDLKPLNFYKSEYTQQQIEHILSHEIIQQCLRNQTIMSEALQPEKRAIGIPMITRGNVACVTYLESTNNFNKQSIQFIESILSRITSALINAQLYEESRVHISELQVLNTEIQNLEQIKTDMIRLASHDLRNPLASISLSMDIMVRYSKEELPDLQKRHFATIQNAVAKMKSIINEILSLEKIEAISQEKLSQVDLVSLVSQVFDSFAQQAHEKDLTYQLHADIDNLLVNGDNALLGEIVGNFISNAIKYTSQGGKVDISIRENAQQAVFEVVDTGIGIDTHEQSQIFQPFFRSSNAKTMTNDGLGLGLHVTKNMITRMNGTTIFNSTPGQGSTFGFQIPLDTSSL